MQPEPKKVQVFDIKLNEEEVSEIVDMLMEFKAGRVYNILRKMETQTSEQRLLSEDKKIYETILIFPQIKKEGY